MWMLNLKSNVPCSAVGGATVVKFLKQTPEGAIAWPCSSCWLSPEFSDPKLDWS